MARKKSSFYSVRISVLCIVEGARKPKEGYLRDIQVHVIAAKDRDEALKRALEIGRAENQTYLNPFGKKVRWVFEEIEEIKCLGDSVLGQELSSRMEWYRPDKTISFNAVFQPEEYRFDE